MSGTDFYGYLCKGSQKFSIFARYERQRSDMGSLEEEGGCSYSGGEGAPMVHFYPHEQMLCSISYDDERSGIQVG
jgi:hypothetical protein